jgi:hypothetical protein
MRPIVGEPQPKRWKCEAAKSLISHCGF